MIRVASIAHRIDCPRMLRLFAFLSILSMLLVSRRAYAQSVVLYENPGFGGRAKTLLTGPNNLSDFLGLTSSIRVPHGLVAVLFQHVDSGGGFGLSLDLLEECPNLAQYNLDNDVAYVMVFSIKPGFLWARGSMRDGQYVAGHWERPRAAGNPPNNVAVVSPPLPARGNPSAASPTEPAPSAYQPPANGDLANSPVATRSEIDEFNNIRDNQYGVGVLGGETTKPFYVHTNNPDETTYKYKKVVDMKYFTGYPGHLLADQLRKFHALSVPLELLTDFYLDIQNFGVDIYETITSTHHTTFRAIDGWYPDSEHKTTLCGTLDTVHVCGQDFVHTKIIVDRDMNFDVTPNEAFKFMLNNRWIGNTVDHLEGEVRVADLVNFNTRTALRNESLVPKNPLLASGLRRGDKVGLFGPWMADILDINLKVPVPLTSSHVEAANYAFQVNNEIHPINQMWIRRGDEVDLVSMVDKTGFFEKHNAAEIQASGYNQKMQYYVAFEVPANDVTVQEYQVDGIGFDYAAHPETDIQAAVTTVNYNGRPCLKIDDNSILKGNRTHHVWFDKTRKRADGSIQGYIVVETVPIVLHGGSINVFVRKIR